MTRGGRRATGTPRFRHDVPMHVRRTGAARVLSATLAIGVLAGCDLGDRDPGSTPTTAPESITCPDGSPLPSAEAAPPATAADPSSDGRAPRPGALDIGTLLPLTGDLAFLGAAATAGVELAVEDLNAAGGVLGEPVTLHHADSADGDDGAAADEVARVLGAGVDVIVGPMAAGVTARVLDQVVQGGAVLVSPGATSSGLDDLDGADRLFRTVPTDSLQGRALAELVLDDGFREAALVVRGDGYGRAVAGAFATAFEDGGGVIRSRLDYEPTAGKVAEEAVESVGGGTEAVVVVGLAESALVVEALSDAGAGPLDRPVYGTDGNLGERLADLVDDPASLACMKGVLPVATPPPAFADRLRRATPSLASLDDAGLEHAAEAYDAVVIAAIATEAAGSDDAEATAAAMADATGGGTPCDDVGACLELVAGGADLVYEGMTGRAALGGAGNRTQADMTVVAFDGDGHLARIGVRRVPD